MLANYLTSFGGYQTAVWDGKGRERTFRVQRSGFRVQGLALRVKGSEFRAARLLCNVCNMWISSRIKKHFIHRLRRLLR
jgi:hypothetical protein